MNFQKKPSKKKSKFRKMKLIFAKNILSRKGKSPKSHEAPPWRAAPGLLLFLVKGFRSSYVGCHFMQCLVRVSFVGFVVTFSF